MMTYRYMILCSALASLCIVTIGAANGQGEAFKLAAGAQSSIFAEAISARAQEAFRASKPRVIVGTTAEGFAAFCREPSSETADVVLASREMTSGEQERCAQAGVKNIIEGQLGYFAQVLIQKTSDPKIDLDTRDIYRAFAASVANGDEFKPNSTRIWNDLNAAFPKTEIRLLITSASQGSRRVFDFEGMADGCRNNPAIRDIFSATHRTALCTTLRKDIVIEEDSTPKRLEALRKSPPGTIALVSYDVYLENQTWTRLIAIDGVLPTPETIVAENYNMTTPLFIIAKPGALRGTAADNSPLSSWLGEALSERAIGSQGYLIQSGLMPLPAAKREAQRNSLKKTAN